MNVKRILKQSRWKSGTGVDPHCYVVLEVEKGKNTEYTTHEMVMRPGKIEPEFYLGHYFTTFEAAAKDFKKRVEKG